MSLLLLVFVTVISMILGGLLTYSYLDYREWDNERLRYADRLTGAPIGAQLAREMNINLSE
jgi:hypothetical protein